MVSTMLVATGGCAARAPRQRTFVGIPRHTNRTLCRPLPRAVSAVVARAHQRVFPVGAEADSEVAGSRRALLLGGAMAMAAAVLPAGGSRAAEDGLPKGYAKLAPKLVDALLDSIQLEEDGANEFEVRRKADAAKPLVREFVGRWKEDRQLEGDRSQKEIKEGLRVLGEFYMNNGQRVALPRAVVDDVRGHLLAARAALPEPEEKKGLLGF
mmetsp:Transcript_3991/g.10086  ORF Transcript_3991/g.10086 Transcript_3991/m.10086 type:complete len:211 (-) Transcript_3991:375-1007(-)|eukprot:jgi/Tetstr1/447441/TSEL_003700.t1